MGCNLVTIIVCLSDRVDIILIVDASPVVSILKERSFDVFVLEEGRHVLRPSIWTLEHKDRILATERIEKVNKA